MSSGHFTSSNFTKKAHHLHDRLFLKTLHLIFVLFQHTIKSQT